MFDVLEPLSFTRVASEEKVAIDAVSGSMALYVVEGCSSFLLLLLLLLLKRLRRGEHDFWPDEPILTVCRVLVVN